MTFATTASGPHAAPDAGLFSALGSEADLVGSCSHPPFCTSACCLTYHLGQNQPSETRFSFLAPMVCSLVIHPQIFLP